MFTLEFAIRFVLAGLSLFAVSVLLAKGEGWDHFIANWRLWVVNLVGTDEETGEPKHQIDVFMSCPYCLGAFVSPVFAALVLLPTLPGDVIITFIGLLGLHYSILWKSTPL